MNVAHGFSGMRAHHRRTRTAQVHVFPVAAAIALSFCVHAQHAHRPMCCTYFPRKTHTLALWYFVVYKPALAYAGPTGFRARGAAGLTLWAAISWQHFYVSLLI